MTAAPPDLGDLRATGESRLEADVLVIGSGAGGSVAAATAAELGHSVIVVEEGPYVPASRAPSRMANSFAKLWRHGGLTVAYGLPPISYAEGRCVGGSTEINSAIFQRAPEELLSMWAARYRIKDFGPDKLEPYYDWAAGIVNASPTPGPQGPPTDILARAGKAMGWRVTQLERGQRDCVGTNMCALACPTGGKQSMTSTLIPRIVSTGSRVISDAKVRRLIMKGRTAIGAIVYANTAEGGRRRLIIKAKKVFVSAGAIHTPALLQDVEFRGPVGRTLRLHPTIKCLVFFKEKIDAPNFRLPLVAITEFMPAMRMGGSIFTPGTYGLAIADDWYTRAPYLKDMRHAMIYYVMARGQGNGHVRGMPGGLSPLVTYKLAAEDWRGLGAGVGRLGQALLRAGATRVLPSLARHEGWTHEAEAKAMSEQPLPRRGARPISIHLFGSCPMGEDDARCAADSFGLVHGADNLYIADASLIPEAPGVNPQATVMAIARRNALRVLGGK